MIFLEKIGKPIIVVAKFECWLAFGEFMTSIADVQVTCILSEEI